MKILFVTPQLPYPARQGTAIRNWGLIKHVAARHTVGLVSMVAPGQSLGGDWQKTAGLMATVPQPPWTLATRLGALLTGEADLARRLWTHAFDLAVGQCVAQMRPDVLQVEGLELVRYLRHARQAHPTLKIVFDAHNAEHMIQRRAWETDRAAPGRTVAATYSRLQMRRLEKLEAEVGNEADSVLCVSGEDAEALRHLAPSAQPVVIPNGIDTADYVPLGAAPSHDVVFTGKMDYRPNLDAALWFGTEIWPVIHAQRPEARFVIVGQQPGERLQGLAHKPGIVITGAVEDTRPYIAGAAVYVAPLRMGGGTRFKLLEAMALERPVVSTRLGAEGFAVEAGRELLLADSAPDLAAACLRVMTDPDLARRLSQAGRAFVVKNHDWGVIIPKLEGVYQGLLAQS